MTDQLGGPGGLRVRTGRLQQGLIALYNDRCNAWKQIHNGHPFFALPLSSEGTSEVAGLMRSHVSAGNSHSPAPSRHGRGFIPAPLPAPGRGWGRGYGENAYALDRDVGVLRFRPG